MSSGTIVICDGMRDGKPCGRVVKPDPRFGTAAARAAIRGWWTDGKRYLCGDCRREEGR
jgi:hypothetical protein